MSNARYLAEGIDVPIHKRARDSFATDFVSVVSTAFALLELFETFE